MRRYFSQRLSNISFIWNIPNFESLPLESVPIPNEEEGDDACELRIVPDSVPIIGTITVSTPPGKPCIHDGINVELHGCVELHTLNNQRVKFLSSIQEVATPGKFHKSKTFSFDFSAQTLPYESFYDAESPISIRFFLACRIKTKYFPPFHEQEFIVRKYSPMPQNLKPHKMEVGVEDTVNLEFEFPKTVLDVGRPVLVGRVHFLLASKKLRRMSLVLRRRESYRASPKEAWTFSGWRELCSYEVMDGAPVREEVVPVRVFLSGIKGLTPTQPDVYEVARVEYGALLVIEDELGHKCFKQTDVVLVRAEPAEPTAASPE